MHRHTSAECVGFIHVQWHRDLRARSRGPPDRSPRQQTKRCHPDTTPRGPGPIDLPVRRRSLGVRRASVAPRRRSTSPAGARGRYGERRRHQRLPSARPGNEWCSEACSGRKPAVADRLSECLIVPFVLILDATAKSAMARSNVCDFPSIRRYSRFGRPIGAWQRASVHPHILRPRGACHCTSCLRCPLIPSSHGAVGSSSRSRLASQVKRSQPRNMSLTACISRCPATTRSPWFECLLLDVNRSSTEASACLICRKTGAP